MIYTINNCIRAFGYTNFDKLIADMGSVDGLKEYVRANGYADIAVAEDTELLLVDVNGKTWHTGCYGAQLEPPKPYLCFTSTGDSTIAMAQEGTPSASTNKVIQYKLNDGQWQTWDLSEVSLHDGDKMYLKSDDEIPFGDGVFTYKYFVMTGSIAASGNIMSLLNFSDTTSNYCFKGLFRNCESLTQAPVLPATTLSEYCYSNMFTGCESLTQAPVLPATTLGASCYSGMFQFCTSLTTAPELPATTLETSCYHSMFVNCRALTTAPELPATTVAYACYESMFEGCVSLTTAPELPATKLANSCYYGMFVRCTSLTTAPELPATTLTEQCYYNMFKSCTSLTTTPALPATTLQSSCYSGMFKSCTSLTQAPELPATTLVTSCYQLMFYGCSKLNYVKAMFIDIADFSVDDWLNSVSETGTFIKSKDATWTNEQAGIPSGWTVQVEGGVTPEPEPERDYLCFTSTGNSTVAMHQEGTPDTSANKVIQYKLNDRQWQTWDLSAVTLADGDKMYVKSDDEMSFAENYGTIYKNFVMTGSIAASGNIMSLLNFSTTLPDYAFYKLFFGCESLTTAPELPATAMSIGCYERMFNNCTSLITAPALPATTLVARCYNSMFQGCTSLVQAPELPATTLPSGSYASLFYECSNLNYVKAMFTTIEIESALYNWLDYVSPTGTFVKNASATWTNEQVYMPTGWTVQTASPDK